MRKAVWQPNRARRPPGFCLARQGRPVRLSGARQSAGSRKQPKRYHHENRENHQPRRGRRRHLPGRLLLHQLALAPAFPTHLRRTRQVSRTPGGPCGRPEKLAPGRIACRSAPMLGRAFFFLAHSKNPVLTPIMTRAIAALCASAFAFLAASCCCTSETKAPPLRPLPHFQEVPAAPEVHYAK